MFLALAAAPHEPIWKIHCDQRNAGEEFTFGICRSAPRDTMIAFCCHLPPRFRRKTCRICVLLWRSLGQIRKLISAAVLPETNPTMSPGTSTHTLTKVTRHVCFNLLQSVVFVQLFVKRCSAAQLHTET